MATKVLDVALDRISKRYPSFKPETGRRVVDTLSDAYKSYQKRKAGGAMADEKGPGLSGVVSGQNDQSLSEVPKQDHPLIDPPAKEKSSEKEKRDSFYDNFEDYTDDNPSTCPTQKFPNEEAAPTSNRIQIEEDPEPNNQRLSDNPPASPDDGDSEKRQLGKQGGKGVDDLLEEKVCGISFLILGL